LRRIGTAPTVDVRAAPGVEVKPAFACLVFSIGILGCAGVPRATVASQAGDAFDGTWSVAWCDRSRPQLDCGGFSVTLVQDGDRICGEFGGALVNLRQLDDGTVVGHVDGDTARLDVTSGRNDEVVRVHARRIDGQLHWRQAEELRRGNGDVSVMAIDEVLAPAAGPSVPVVCDMPVD